MNEKESWPKTLAIGVGLLFAIVVGGLLLLLLTSAVVFVFRD